MLGVVKLNPVPIAVPFVEAANHSIVSLVPAVAESTKVPVPHLVAPVVTGEVGKLFIDKIDDAEKNSVVQVPIILQRY